MAKEREAWVTLGTTIIQVEGEGGSERGWQGLSERERVCACVSEIW